MFKILFIGNSRVGKSSILFRYTDNQFYETLMNTIGVDFKVKFLEVHGKKVKLQIVIIFKKN
jgi:GTPase SAR1 family protein